MFVLLLFDFHKRASCHPNDCASFGVCCRRADMWGLPLPHFVNEDNKRTSPHLRPARRPPTQGRRGENIFYRGHGFRKDDDLFWLMRVSIVSQVLVGEKGVNCACGIKCRPVPKRFHVVVFLRELFRTFRLRMRSYEG